MFLTEKNGSPLFLLVPFGPNRRPVGAGVFEPFEKRLVGRLRSLLPVSDSSPRPITLQWLSRAVDLLSATLADAVAVISNPALSSSDRAALSSYLDSSAALLDVCNTIFAAADRILRVRLLVRLALHLISSSPSLSSDRRRRARSVIAEWEDAASSEPLRCGFHDLVNRLRPEYPSRGRLTAVRRIIYAVEAVSDLVARSCLASLGAKADALSGICDAGGYPWAASYNEVVAAVSAKLYPGGRASEVEEAEASIRILAAAVVEDGGEEVTEEVRNAGRAAEKTVEGLTEGLDMLTDAVNQLFRSSLATRDAALRCFRVGSEKCK